MNSYDTLCYWLDITPPQATQDTRRVTYKSAGNGPADLHKLLSNDLDAIADIEIEPQQSPVTKIVLTNPLLGRRTEEDKADEFVSTLFAHSNRLEILLPLKNSDGVIQLEKIRDYAHYIEVKGHVCLLTSEEIERTLSRTGEPRSTFMVVDYLCYQQIRNRMHNTQNVKLDLDVVSPDNEVLWQALACDDPSLILKATYPLTPLVCKRIETYFPGCPLELHVVHSVQENDTVVIANLPSSFQKLSMVLGSKMNPNSFLGSLQFAPMPETRITDCEIKLNLIRVQLEKVDMQALTSLYSCSLESQQESGGVDSLFLPDGIKQLRSTIGLHNIYGPPIQARSMRDRSLLRSGVFFLDLPTVGVPFHTKSEVWGLMQKDKGRIYPRVTTLGLLEHEQEPRAIDLSLFPNLQDLTLPSQMMEVSGVGPLVHTLTLKNPSQALLNTLPDHFPNLEVLALQDIADSTLRLPPLRCVKKLLCQGDAATVQLTEAPKLKALYNDKCEVRIPETIPPTLWIHNKVSGSIVRHSASGEEQKIALDYEQEISTSLQDLLHSNDQQMPTLGTKIFPQTEQKFSSFTLFDKREQDEAILAFTQRIHPHLLTLLLEELATIPALLLDPKKMPRLEVLEAFVEKLPGQQDISNFPALQSVKINQYVSSASSSVIVLSHNPSLHTLGIKAESDIVLDLSGCDALHTLEIEIEGDVTFVGTLSPALCASLQFVKIQAKRIQGWDITAEQLTNGKLFSIQTDTSLRKRKEAQLAATTPPRRLKGNGFSSVRQFASEIRTQAKHTNQGAWEIEIQGQNAEANYYRHGMCTHIDFDPTSACLHFRTESDQEAEKHLQDILVPWVNTMPTSAVVKTHLGYFKGTLSPGERIMLPNVQLREKLLQIYSRLRGIQNKVRIRWHKEEQCYYLQLQPQVKHSVAFEFTYLLEQNLAYKIIDGKRINLTSYKLQPLQQKLAPPLQAATDQALQNLVKSMPQHWGFLLDPNLSLEAKASNFLQKVSRFVSNPLSQKTNDLDNLFRALAETTGSCASRSEAVMLVLQGLGIQAKVSGSPIHAWVELHLIMPNNQIFCVGVDLGGTPVIFVSPSKKRKPEPAAVLRPAVTMTPEELALDQTVRKLLIPTEVKDRADLAALLLQKDPEHKAPAIVLQSGQTEEACNRAIMQCLQEQGRDPLRHHLYIRSPKELAQFIKGYAIDEVTGIPLPIEGPRTLLFKEGGLLVIDLTNFSDAERVAVQSLLEKRPTLEGVKVPEHVRVIVLSRQDQHGQDTSFTSRVHRYTVANSVFAAAPPPLAKKEPRIIDLQGSMMWSPLVLGKIEVNCGVYSQEKGPLLQAIEEERPVVFVNPPEDNASWERFFCQLSYEQKIGWNGGYKAALLGPLCRVERRIIAKSFPQNLTVYKEVEKFPPDAVHVHPGNWHTLFIRRKWHAENTTYSTVSGFLYEEKYQDIVVHGELSAAEWNHFIAILRTMPGRKFSCYVAKNSRIGGVDMDTTNVMVEKSGFLPSRCYQTNDPEHTLAKVRETFMDPLVIDISLLTRLDDLLETWRITPTENGSFSFVYEELALAKAIQENRPVLLKGEPNALLYEALQPLLSPEDPHAYIQGERIKITAPITLIMPSKVEVLSFAEQCQQVGLTEDHPIRLWVACLRQMPQLGLPISCTWLSRMLRVFEEKIPLHPHHPLKDFIYMLDPAGRRGALYPVLNVLGKYYLAPHDKAGVRLHVLQSLVQAGKTVRHDPWQFLNAFRGKTLHALLGEPSQDMTGSVRWENGQPFLSEEALGRVETLVTQLMAHAPLQHAPSKLQKGQAKVIRLLQDPNTKIVMAVGEAGVGKTHMRKILKENLPSLTWFEGIDAIPAWLKAGAEAGDHTRMLFLDEANLHKEGTWEILKALARGEEEVVYQGIRYPLGSHLKVYGNGNVRNFPGRYRHSDVFEQYGRFVYVDPWSDHDLIQTIAVPLLKAEDFTLNPSLLTAIYRKAEKFLPDLPFSVRDFQNLTLRFRMLARENREPLIALYQAACSEFVGCFPPEHPVLYDHFCQEVSAILQLKIAPLVHGAASSRVVKEGALYLPVSQEPRMASLRQFLPLTQEKGPTKRMVVLEGKPGCGKTERALHVLVQDGYVQLDVDKLLSVQENTRLDTRQFVVIDPKTPHIEEVLACCFKHGLAIVLNELNIDKKLESILNTHLDESDAKGSKTRVLASQNLSSMPGRVPVAKSLFNRSTLYLIMPLNAQEKEACVVESGVKVAGVPPTRMVQLITKVMHEIGDTTDRTFWQVLRYLDPQTSTRTASIT